MAACGAVLPSGGAQSGRQVRGPVGKWLVEERLCLIGLDEGPARRPRGVGLLGPWPLAPRGVGLLGPWPLAPRGVVHLGPRRSPCPRIRGDGPESSGGEVEATEGVEGGGKHLVVVEPVGVCALREQPQCRARRLEGLLDEIAIWPTSAGRRRVACARLACAGVACAGVACAGVACADLARREGSARRALHDQRRQVVV